MLHVQSPAQKLTINGYDGSAYPDDDKDNREYDGGLVVGLQAEHDGKGHTDEEWTPQVPIAKLGAHLALYKKMQNRTCSQGIDHFQISANIIDQTNSRNPQAKANRRDTALIHIPN